MKGLVSVLSFLFFVCLPLSAQTQQTIRVDAGSYYAYRDTKGQLWSADHGFNTGTHSNSAPSATVTGTSDPKLFKSARVGVAKAPELQYQFALANGLYKVNLYFAETYYKKAGSRVFDVQMQGATVFSGLDIFAQVGADHALVKTALISVTKGQIVIRFVHRANENVPLISAIEILPSVAVAAPSVTTQPVSESIIAGQSATFKVVAAGTAPLSYQWQKNGMAISGGTSATYTTPVATSADNGETFHVLISNSAGHVTSAAATLTVTSSGGHYVTLNWTASTSPGVIGYNVYRSTMGGSGYSKLNPSPVGGLSYKDATVVNGQTYYYVTTALDSIGDESEYSEEVKTSIPLP